MRRFLGVLAAAQMIVVSTVDGLTRPGFDMTRQWISHLSLGEHGWIGTADLATCGLWLILCATAVPRSSLIMVCGFCLVALAVVRTDAGLGFPPGVPVEHTTRGLIHQLISVVLACAGVGAVIRTGPRKAAWTIAGLMVVTFGAATVLVLLDAAGRLSGTPHGLLERAALFAGLSWIGGAAWRSPGRRHRAGPSTAGAGPGRTPGAAAETAAVEGG
ncbi:hypothetical protein J3R03_004471 [Actinoplanes couchii]|nr:hypothetical protein [Actinoplanes couchii]